MSPPYERMISYRKSPLNTGWTCSCYSRCKFAVLDFLLDPLEAVQCVI